MPPETALYGPVKALLEAQGFEVKGEIVGCDVVEVYPAYEHAQITALLAANVAYEFLSLLALSKKTGST